VRRTHGSGNAASSGGGVVWCYHTPLPEAAKIADLVCFYTEKVEISVDGVAEVPPVTGFSKPGVPAAATRSF